MRLLTRDFLPIEVAHLVILVREISDLGREVKMSLAGREVLVDHLLMVV